MPVKIVKNKNSNTYKVSGPSGVKAKSITKANAEKQKRLLNAVEHGFVPTKRK